MVQAIVFDLMGVTFKQPHLLRKVLHPLLEQRGLLKTDFKTLEETYRAFLLGRIERDKFWHTVSSDYSREFEENFLKTLEINQHFPLAAKKLRKKYVLACLSNIPSPWGRWLIEKRGLRKYFKTIVLSGDTGFSKPDPRIYEILARKLAIPPSEWLYVDDLPGNIAEGAKLGAKTAWMKLEESETGGFKPDYVLESLKQLPELLLEKK